MSDLIERRAAISLAGDLQIHGDEYHMYNQAINNYCTEIMGLPPAQPDLPIKEKCAYCPHCRNCDVNDDLSIAQPERKKGKWIHGREIARQYLINELVNVEYENYHCSECGYTVENIRWNVDGELMDRYCSVCGVEMEGEQDV